MVRSFSIPSSKIFLLYESPKAWKELEGGDEDAGRIEEGAGGGNREEVAGGEKEGGKNVEGGRKDEGAWEDEEGGWREEEEGGGGEKGSTKEWGGGEEGRDERKGGEGWREEREEKLRVERSLGLISSLRGKIKWIYEK